MHSLGWKRALVWSGGEVFWKGEGAERPTLPENRVPGGSGVAGSEALSKPVASSVHLEDVNVVREPVEHGVRERL